jgi:hypothetical protein
MSSNHSGQSGPSTLPSTFEEFAADDVECDECGDDVRPKHAVDGKCVGCRYRGDDARDDLEEALQNAENPLVRCRIREAIMLRKASEEVGL